MSLKIGQPTTWDALLIDWAERALQNSAPSHHLIADSEALRAAFATCEAITADHSKTFTMASGLLPREKRRAVRALYAFCRVTDDIVDRAVPGADPSDVRAALETWRMQALQLHPRPDQPVALAWAETRARFGVPVGYAEQLIDGVAGDLTKKRYATFEELAAYAYGVASTVGLMAMHIVGFNKEDGSRALPYAVRLGVALQITNILRDVAEDWRGGRLYLPLDELAAHGLSEADIAAGRVDDRWRAFMREQIDRTRKLYEEAMPGIAMLHPAGRLAIAAAADLYRAILDDIEANDYDVFSRRAHVSSWGKLRRLPGIWWRSHRADMVHL
ncbi:MAG: squalene/phytoene synthase family protein [Chloroflexi bacterium]|nr:squalene/phytoene synthase family protein [Chloroflexota bacterium]